MANPTVGSLKLRVSAILTGLDLDNVNDLYGAFATAVSEMLQKAFVPECMDVQPITLYSGVYDYVPDPRIFGNQVIDLRPQGLARNFWDFTSRKPSEQFDRMKQILWNGTMIAFETRSGKQIMRVAQTKSQSKIIVDTCSDITGWVAGGSASGLAADAAVYYQSPASLRFNLASSGSLGTLTKTVQSLDLSSYAGVGVVFVAVQMPTATDISKIGILLGSDANNYYNASATQGFLGAFVANEWLLIALDLSKATTVGNPVSTAITYCQVYFDYDNVQLNNVRIGQIWASLPYPSDLVFQTPAIFLASNSTLPSLDITNDSDQITLSRAPYMILQYEAASAVAFQQGGTIAGGVVETIHGKLYGARARTGAVIEMGLYDLYRGDNPQEAIREVGNWYEEPEAPSRW